MLRKNTAGQFVHIQGIDATTGGIKSGVSWTMRRCLDGTFAAGGATITEDSTNGWYKVALAQADTNANNCGYNFTGTGAIPVTINVITTAADPTDSVRFGLTALPNATAGANTGLPVVGTQVPNATAGAANGLVIAGSNAATTFAGLTTGALSCTTITASGAVAFQSTFAVTTSTSLAALSATTVTASGAVAFQSTFAVTGTTTLTGAVSLGSTLGIAGTTTLAALTTTGTVTMNALTVSNATTLTGAVSLGSTLGITGVITATAANDIRLGATQNAAAADALLGRNVAGGSSTGRIVSEALYFLRNKWTVSAGTLTVYATDDTTSSWTATVGTTPGADPITSNDPA